MPVDPARINTEASEKKRAGVARALALLTPLLEACTLCPRRCGVNRLGGEVGFCGIGAQAKVASWGPHFGEEAPLVGSGGSGAVFFSGCNLRCTFCQNASISKGGEGEPVSARELANLFLALQRLGCANINWVTPTHVTPQALAGLALALEGGLELPLVYNCGGYEDVAVLKALAGVVDIYLPDMKFWEPRWAEHFCQAPDYPDRMRDAVREMHRQVGDLHLNAQGIADRGLLVRHLVMPEGTAGTVEVMGFIAGQVSLRTAVNVMAQYHPCSNAAADPVANRRVTGEEYRKAWASTRQAGLEPLENTASLRWMMSKNEV